MRYIFIIMFFFFNDTATTEIYTLSLHDALPISVGRPGGPSRRGTVLGLLGCSRTIWGTVDRTRRAPCSYREDRKSTRLNSSHANISYAVFCLKKTNTQASEQQLKCQKSNHHSLY